MAISGEVISPTFAIKCDIYFSKCDRIMIKRTLPHLERLFDFKTVIDLWKPSVVKPIRQRPVFTNSKAVALA